MFKAIVFDFGNVLCGVDRMAFARAAAPYSAFTPKEVDAAIWGGTLEHDFETGAFDSHEYFKRASALLRFSSEYQYETFATDYRRIIVPHPEGERGLKRADELGARTFILSNTSFLHATMIFSNEILASIPEQHILSYKIGVMKPDPRIWKVLLERSGLDARECVYIDDVEKYCAAARELGFNAIRYDKNEHNLSRIVEDVLQ